VQKFVGLLRLVHAVSVSFGCVHEEEFAVCRPFTWTDRSSEGLCVNAIMSRPSSLSLMSDPQTARRLVGNSGMSRSQQRAGLAQLPGAPAPMRLRVVAGALVVMELVNLAAPLIQAEQAREFEEDVRKGLDDIMWWQSKGVFPRMRAIDDRFLRSNLDRRPRSPRNLLRCYVWFTGPMNCGTSTGPG
jgi:hypothetical protein